ncbi:thioredoxin family protein [Lagierella sp.]|uniref:thioredoxin family protein n=1 Tax=Lagierella sp. TaxID=2849657 RepID=UPI002619E061|nr:thioredoxin family protein [Lagierella sp.]
MKLVDFNEEYKKGTKLLFIKGAHCALCDAMLEKTLKELDPYTIDMTIIELQDHPQIRGQYLIFSFPTMILLEDGKEIARESGYFDLSTIKRIIS